MPVLPLFILFTLIWNIQQSLNTTQLTEQPTIQSKPTSPTTRNNLKTSFRTSFKTRFYNSPENHQCRVNREAEEKRAEAAEQTESTPEPVPKKPKSRLFLLLWFFSLFAFIEVFCVALCKFCRRVDELDSHSTVPLSRSELELEKSSKCISLLFDSFVIYLFLLFSQLRQSLCLLILVL